MPGRRPGRPKVKPTAIGKLIAQRRRRAGLTQQDLGTAFGLTREAISAIEKGTTKVPSVEMLNRLPDVLPVTELEVWLALGLRLPPEIAALLAQGQATLAFEDELIDGLEAWLKRVRRRWRHGEADGAPG